MIPARYYLTIYLVAVTLLTILVSNVYSKKNNAGLNKPTVNDCSTGYIVATIVALFIGFRPMSVLFVDMVNYHDIYLFLHYGKEFIFNWNTENIIFDNFVSFLASNRYDLTIFFVLVSLFYFVGTYKAMTRFFPKDALYGFIVFLGAFSTFSYGTNGIKAGSAAAIFLLALAYKNKPVLSWIFAILSIGFHHSMVVPVGGYIAATFVKDNKKYMYFWLLALGVALLHITFFQNIFASFADESGSSYLTSTENWGGKTGFRYDFVIYSAIPIFVGYKVLYTYKLRSASYNFLLNIYTFTNAIWMLCMYASFTNRIAYLSWLMYPVVLVYPFFQKEFMPRQYQMLNKVAWLQLSITLALEFIYYG